MVILFFCILQNQHSKNSNTTENDYNDVSIVDSQSKAVYCQENLTQFFDFIEIFNYNLQNVVIQLHTVDIQQLQINSLDNVILLIFNSTVKNISIKVLQNNSKLIIQNSFMLHDSDQYLIDNLTTESSLIVDNSTFNNIQLINNSLEFNQIILTNSQFNSSEQVFNNLLGDNVFSILKIQECKFENIQYFVDLIHQIKLTILDSNFINTNQLILQSQDSSIALYDLNISFTSKYSAKSIYLLNTLLNSSLYIQKVYVTNTLTINLTFINLFEGDQNFIFSDSNLIINSENCIFNIITGQQNNFISNSHFQNIKCLFNKIQLNTQFKVIQSQFSNIQTIINDSYIVKTLRFQSCQFINLQQLINTSDTTSIQLVDSVFENSTDLLLISFVDNTVLYIYFTAFKNITSQKAVLVETTFNLKLELKCTQFSNITVTHDKNVGLIGSMTGFFLIQNVKIENYTVTNCIKNCGVLFATNYATGRAFDVVLSGQFMKNVEKTTQQNQFGLIGTRMTRVRVELAKVQMFISKCQEKDFITKQEINDELLNKKEDSPNGNSSQINEQLDDLPENYKDIDYIVQQQYVFYKILNNSFDDIENHKHEYHNNQDQSYENQYDQFQKMFKEYEYTVLYQYNCKKQNEINIEADQYIGIDQYKGEQFIE